jgi:hypothetical protein
MADQEQLRILKQGGEAWNAWRRQRAPDAPVDLSGADPLWCMKAWPTASVRRVEYHRIRTETGMPKLVIRLSKLHPIFASVR